VVEVDVVVEDVVVALVLGIAEFIGVEVDADAVGADVLEVDTTGEVLVGATVGGSGGGGGSGATSGTTKDAATRPTSTGAPITA
jgi:hypothetical protein